MQRPIFISWLVLVFLTTIGFVTRINHGSEMPLWFLIPLILAVIKIGVVAWYFMELRTVSRIWVVGMGFLTMVIFVMVAILQWQVARSL